MKELDSFFRVPMVKVINLGYFLQACGKGQGLTHEQSHCRLTCSDEEERRRKKNRRKRRKIEEKE